MRNHAVPLRYVTAQCVCQIGSMSARSRKCKIQTILRCGAWAWMDFDDEHVTAYRRARRNGDFWSRQAMRSFLSVLDELRLHAKSSEGLSCR
jgi:hypothetical protein